MYIKFNVVFKIIKFFLSYNYFMVREPRNKYCIPMKNSFVSHLRCTISYNKYIDILMQWTKYTEYTTICTENILYTDTDKDTILYFYIIISLFHYFIIFLLYIKTKYAIQKILFMHFACQFINFLQGIYSSMVSY